MHIRACMVCMRLQNITNPHHGKTRQHKGMGSRARNRSSLGWGTRVGPIPVTPPPPPPLVLPIFIERNVRRRIGYVTIPRASHCVILMIILTQKPHYLSVLCDMFSKRVNNALGLTKASFLPIAKANSQALSECFQIL